MPDPKVTVYGAPWYPDCKRAKQFLGEQRMPYNWVDIDQDEDGRKYVQQVNNGKQIIPTIIFEDGSSSTSSTETTSEAGCGMPTPPSPSVWSATTPTARPARTPTRGCG